MKVGDWYQIKPRSDRGGVPLIRVEAVEQDGTVLVSDWLTFKQRHIAPLRTFEILEGREPELTRRFIRASQTENDRRRLMLHWRKVSP